MENKKLLTTIESILDDLKSENLEILFQNKNKLSFDQLIQLGNLLQGISKKLKNYLDSKEKIKSNYLIRKIDGSASAIDEDIVSYLLIKNSFEIGINKALNLVDQLLDLDEATCLQITLASGVEIQEEFTLSNTIRIIPMANLPPYSELNIFAGIWKYELKDLIYQGYAEQFAIVQEANISPLFVDQEKQILDSDEIKKLRKEMQNALFAISLGSGSSIYEHLTFAKFKNDELNILQRGSGYSRPLLDYWPGNPSYKKNVNWEYVLSIFQKLSKSKGKFYKDFSQIMKRFIKTQNLFDQKQLALELSIILEFIFMDNANTEMSYRISNRAAWFLGSVINERADIKSVIKKIYDIRSQFVHGDKSIDKIKMNRSDGSSLNATEITSLGLDITRKIISKILDQGKFLSDDELRKLELGI